VKSEADHGDNDSVVSTVLDCTPQQYRKMSSTETVRGAAMSGSKKPRSSQQNPQISLILNAAGSGRGGGPPKKPPTAAAAAIAGDGPDKDDKGVFPTAIDKLPVWNDSNNDDKLLGLLDELDGEVNILGSVFDETKAAKAEAERRAEDAQGAIKKLEQGLNLTKAEAEKLAANVLEADKARKAFADMLDQEKHRAEKLEAVMENERKGRLQAEEEAKGWISKAKVLEARVREDYIELGRKSELIKRAVQALQEHKKKLAEFTSVSRQY